MHRQHLRLLRFTILLPFIPVLWTAYKTYRYERYLKTLAISLSDFPPPYVDALTLAVAAHEEIQFDHSIFSTSSSTASPNSIPPRIHFIWYRDLYNITPAANASNIPHSGSHAPARCELFNPTFEITIWDAEAGYEFLSEHYPWILPTYNSYVYPIQRVDALKYFLLYHFGGVYMDMNIACRRPLDPLLRFAAWFPKATPFGINNDLMAARPKHPLIGHMVQSLQARNRGLGSAWVTIFWSTGPKFASDMVKEWVAEHWTKPRIEGVREYDDEADADAFYILPEQFYSQDPGYTFFGHSPGGTWYGDDAHFVVWLLDRPWSIGVIVGLPILMCVALVLRKKLAQHRHSRGGPEEKVPLYRE